MNAQLIQYLLVNFYGVFSKFVIRIIAIFSKWASPKCPRRCYNYKTSSLKIWQNWRKGEKASEHDVTGIGLKGEIRYIIVFAVI